MKKFEVGKEYFSAGHFMKVKCEKVTAEYVTFSGDYNGRKQITSINIFGMGDHVFLPYKNFNLLVTASYTEL